MEPRNFENHIKEQLQKREIAPSAAGWEKLNAQLDAQQTKKTNKFWWMGIAAAVAVGIFIGTSVFSPSGVEPQMVETPVKEIYSEEKQVETRIASEEIVTETKDEEAAFSNSKKSIPQPIIPEAKQTRTYKKEQNASAIAQNKVEKPATESKINTPQVIPVEMEMAVAQNLPQEEDLNSAEQEAAKLLAKARKEIYSEQSYNPQTSIAGSSLLQDVEEDLYRSFRNQVFEVLKEGFTKVRVAVAERNN